MLWGNWRKWNWKRNENECNNQYASENDSFIRIGTNGFGVGGCSAVVMVSADEWPGKCDKYIKSNGDVAMTANRLMAEWRDKENLNLMSSWWLLQQLHHHGERHHQQQQLYDFQLKLQLSPKCNYCINNIAAFFVVVCVRPTPSANWLKKNARRYNSFRDYGKYFNLLSLFLLYFLLLSLCCLILFLLSSFYVFKNYKLNWKT